MAGKVGRASSMIQKDTVAQREAHCLDVLRSTELSPQQKKQEIDQSLGPRRAHQLVLSEAERANTEYEKLFSTPTRPIPGIVHPDDRTRFLPASPSLQYALGQDYRQRELATMSYNSLPLMQLLTTYPADQRTVQALGRYINHSDESTRTVLSLILEQNNPAYLGIIIANLEYDDSNVEMRLRSLSKTLAAHPNLRQTAYDQIMPIIRDGVHHVEISKRNLGYYIANPCEEEIRFLRSLGFNTPELQNLNNRLRLLQTPARIQ